MEGLRILLVHNYYRIRGGEDSVFENEKKLLTDGGHKVFTYTRHNENAGRGLFGKLRLPFTTVFSRRTYRDICRIIKQEKIEIVHVHNTLSLISPAVFRAAKKMGVPVVQTIHNFRMLCPAATLYRDGKICEDCISCGLSSAVRHRCYRGSKFGSFLLATTLRIHRALGTFRHVHFICLTEFNREMLLRLNRKKQVVDPAKIYIKPNFATSPTHTPTPVLAREKLLLYAGRLDEIKGISVLLSAVTHLPQDYRLLIAGAGPAEDTCRAFIKENNLEGQVEMLGQKSVDEVRALMANARATVLPTLWYEGFPMTIAESLSVGTPVIVSDLGNAGAIVKEGVTGLHFPAGDAAALAACAKALPELAKSCRAYFDAHLTPTANLLSLTEIYQTILGES